MKPYPTKAFRIRNKDGKYASLRGEYVHFVKGKGKLCVGEEALFNFIEEVKWHLKVIPSDGNAKDLVVEEYDLTPVAESNLQSWQKRADKFFAEKQKKQEEKNKKREAREWKRWKLWGGEAPDGTWKTPTPKPPRFVKLGKTVEGTL